MSAPARPWTGRRLHLIGVGGAGMSAYALAAHALGATVTGSDRAPSPFSERLREQGILEALTGHSDQNIPAGDDVEVVHSSAVPAENPERLAARERGLRCLTRGRLLKEFSALRPTIAVAGAHGKTTTASMVVHALQATGADPSYLIGGVLRSTGSNAAWGEGDWLVVEADESDRSMLDLEVQIAVLTNVELDHHATFGSEAELREAFREFLAGAPEAVVWDRPELLELRDGPVQAYDVTDAVLQDGGSTFSWRGHEVSLPVPGLHNARNAAGALEACRLAGADAEAAARSLVSFSGVGRRFERIGRTNTGAEVFDDYAHHPTEVAATLAAARTLGAARLIAVFQPHLYSRTAMLFEEFGSALAAADVVVVLDVYPARERAQDFPGVSGRLITQTAADAAGGRAVYWLPTFDDAQPVLERLAGEGDLLLVLGAGDVDGLGHRLVASPGGTP